MNIDDPFHFDGRGRTATVDDDGHICDMIKAFLFTNAGERVNRPDYGSGLLQIVFDPNSLALAAAVQHTIQAGLQRWLGDIIEIRNLEVENQEAELKISIQYLVRRTGEVQSSTFQRSNV